MGDGEADAEDGVGAEVGLVGRAVEVDAGGGRRRAGRAPRSPRARRGSSSFTWPTAFEHALAAVAVAAVAELDGLELAGGRARRDDGPPGGAGREEDLDLDGGVAARVEDLAPATCSMSMTCDGLLLLLQVWRMVLLGRRPAQACSADRRARGKFRIIRTPALRAGVAGRRLRALAIRVAARCRGPAPATSPTASWCVVTGADDAATPPSRASTRPGPASWRSGPAMLSPVVLSPDGPLLRVGSLDGGEDAPAETVPDVVAAALEAAGVDRRRRSRCSSPAARSTASTSTPNAVGAAACSRRRPGRTASSRRVARDRRRVGARRRRPPTSRGRCACWAPRSTVAGGRRAGHAPRRGGGPHLVRPRAGSIWTTGSAPRRSPSAAPPTSPSPPAGRGCDTRRCWPGSTCSATWPASSGRRGLRVRRPRGDLRPDRHRPARHAAGRATAAPPPTWWPARPATSSCPTCTPSRCSGPATSTGCGRRRRRRQRSTRRAARRPALEVALGDPGDWLPVFDARERRRRAGAQGAGRTCWSPTPSSPTLAERAPGADRRGRRRAARGAGQRPGPDLERRHARRGPPRPPRPAPHAPRAGAWLGHEPHSDAPAGVSPVLAAYARWSPPASTTTGPPGAQALRGPPGRHPRARAAAGRRGARWPRRRGAGLAAADWLARDAGARVAAGRRPASDVAAQLEKVRRLATAATSTCQLACSTLLGEALEHLAAATAQQRVERRGVGGLGAASEASRLGRRVRGGVDGRSPTPLASAAELPRAGGCARGAALAATEVGRRPMSAPRPRRGRGRGRRGATRAGPPAPSTSTADPTTRPGTWRRAAGHGARPRRAGRRIARSAGAATPSSTTSRSADDRGAATLLADLVRRRRSRPRAPSSRAPAAAEASDGRRAWAHGAGADPRRGRRRARGDAGLVAAAARRRPACVHHAGPARRPRRAAWRSPGRPPAWPPGSPPPTSGAAALEPGAGRASAPPPSPSSTPSSRSDSSS